MKRLWRICWFCYCVTFSALMFAVASGVIHLSKPVGLSLSIGMVLGGCIDWRVTRSERATPAAPPA